MWITCHVVTNAVVGVITPSNEIESRRKYDEAEWTPFNRILYIFAMQMISNHVLDELELKEQVK